MKSEVRKQYKVSFDSPATDETNEERIYSAMDCGCYHTKDCEEWTYCEYHQPTLKSNKFKSIGPLEKANYHLYALRLKNDKYYVGMTVKKNPLNRINQHGSLRGAQWTLHYPPEEILEILDIGLVTKEEAENLENDLTHKYIDLYGFSNVRGGRMASVRRPLLRVYNPGTWQEILKTSVKVAGIVSFIAFFVFAVLFNN